MIAKAANAAALDTLAVVPTRNGSATTSPMASSTPTNCARRTSGNRFNSRGTGRICSAFRQVDVVSSSARVPLLRRNSSVATITAPSAAGTARSESGISTSPRTDVEFFHVTAWMSTPTASADTTTVGRSLSRPSNSAVRPPSNTVSPNAPAMGNPNNPADRNSEMNERDAAIAQTYVWMRLTGMPSSSARSADSAEARMAMPTLVYRRIAPTASIAAGASTQAMTNCERNGRPPTVSVQSKGYTLAGSGSKTGSLFHNSEGIHTAATARIWATPMVATVVTSLGAAKNRRMIASSTTPPTNRAVAMPPRRTNR